MNLISYFDSNSSTETCW